ncbi:MAG: hypothetical protein Q4G51_11500 [Dermatophilus congolensis]|nr:hypothetical protein [Dermatophilus congolensis]
MTNEPTSGAGRARAAVFERTSTRLMFLAPAAVAMLAGLNAGLGLADAPVPVASPRLEGVHGMLMVLGFLGTLIALERAVALRAPWGFLAPGLLGAGGLALVLPLPLVVAQVLLVAGCSAFLAVYGALFQRSRDDLVLAQAMGAFFALVAAALWMIVELPDLTPWLISFLVLTIASERIELARIAMPRSAGAVLTGFGVALTVVLVLDLTVPMLGRFLFGLLLLVLVAWLVRYDVARRMVRSGGLPRFSAAAMLTGYTWLAIAGLTWYAAALAPVFAPVLPEAIGWLAPASSHTALAADLPGGNPRVPLSEVAYEVALHSAFVGFALSMVIAHASVILPAVLKRPLPYRRIAWVPLVFLHAALALRLGAAAVDGLAEAWRVGIVATVVAVLLFALVSVVTSLLASSASRAGTRPPARPAGNDPATGRTS